MRYFLFSQFTFPQASVQTFNLPSSFLSLNFPHFPSSLKLPSSFFPRSSFLENKYKVPFNLHNPFSWIILRRMHIFLSYSVHKHTINVQFRICWINQIFCSILFNWRITYYKCILSLLVGWMNLSSMYPPIMSWQSRVLNKKGKLRPISRVNTLSFIFKLKILNIVLQCVSNYQNKIECLSWAFWKKKMSTAYFNSCKVFQLENALSRI